MLGVISGAFLGVVIPFAVCLSHDRLVRPPGGSGWLSAGWMLCLVTAPVAALAACVFSARYVWFLMS